MNESTHGQAIWARLLLAATLSLSPVIASAQEAKPAHPLDALTGAELTQVKAILKAEGSVHGTATAASIWNTGVVGAAVAMDRYILAAALAALNLIALRVLLPLKLKLDAREGDSKSNEQRKRDLDL